MFRPKTLTLIFLGRERIVRCDVDPVRRTQIGCWARPRPMAAEVPALVETALRLATKRPGKVWVLAEDFWTHKLAVSPEAMIGLTPAEIGRALAFEAESLSGQQAVDSELGFTPLGVQENREEFWVVQTPSWVRDQVDECVQKAGGQLAGLIHPAGLPVPMSPPAVQFVPWQRTEYWQGLIASVGAAADGRLRQSMVSADARNAAAARALDQWRQELGHTAINEQLAINRRGAPADLAGTVFDLSDEGTLSRWLLGWGLVLSQQATSVPTIAPMRRPMSPAARLAIALAIATVVVGIAAVDRWRLNGRLESLHADAAAIGARAKLAIQASAATDASIAAKTQEIADKTKQTEDRDKEVEGHRQAIAKLEGQVEQAELGLARVAADVPHAEQSIIAYRDRWAKLLMLAAAHCPEHVVVRGMGSNNRTPAIRGVSLGVGPITAFAADLSEQLRPLGWTVHPSYSAVEHAAGTAALYEFTISLSELTIPHGAADVPQLAQATDDVATADTAP